MPKSEVKNAKQYLLLEPRSSDLSGRALRIGKNKDIFGFLTFLGNGDKGKVIREWTITKSELNACYPPNCMSHLSTCPPRCYPSMIF